MSWPALELAIGTIIIGAAVNWIVMVIFFWWKKREDVPDDLSNRMQRIEQAFVAHTGITLNGKDYKKEH